MTSLNPHITFDGNAREALTYYQSVFGGETHFIPVGDRAGADMPKDAIFHSELRGQNFTLMAADATCRPSSQNRTSLHILCADRPELDRYFAALSAGGSIHCGVGPAFGGLFAMVTDRYGVTWYLTLPG